MSLHPRPAPLRQPLPSDAGLRHWLQVPGSLTQHLRATGQTLKVHRLAQRTDAGRGDEPATLGRSGRRVHARDVLLELDGAAVVYARSVTPARAVRGPWRALLGLGSRPLAELLYTQRGIRRTPLQAHKLAPHGPWRSYVQHQLTLHVRRGELDASNPLLHARTMWARHSVFYKRGQPLRVMEVFAPAVAGLRRHAAAAAATMISAPAPSASKG